MGSFYVPDIEGKNYFSFLYTCLNKFGAVFFFQFFSIFFRGLRRVGMSYKGHFFKHHLNARPPPPGAGPRARALFAYRLTGPWTLPVDNIIMQCRMFTCSMVHVGLPVTTKNVRVFPTS